MGPEVFELAGKKERNKGKMLLLFPSNKKKSRLINSQTNTVFPKSLRGSSVKRVRLFHTSLQPCLPQLCRKSWILVFLVNRVYFEFVAVSPCAHLQEFTCITLLIFFSSLLFSKRCIDFCIQYTITLWCCNCVFCNQEYVKMLCVD